MKTETIKKLHFVFDRIPDQDGCTFIEVENESGHSVNAGDWKVRADGLAELVVPINYDGSVPPLGDVEVVCYQFRHSEQENWYFTDKASGYWEHRGLVLESDYLAHVTRLQAEIATYEKAYSIVVEECRKLVEDRDALKPEVERLIEQRNDQVRRKLDAYKERDQRQSELTKTRELNPVNWTDRQILDFLGVALRNVDLVGEVRLSEIRQGFQYMQERQSAPAAKEGES